MDERIRTSWAGPAADSEYLLLPAGQLASLTQAALAIAGPGARLVSPVRNDAGIWSWSVVSPQSVDAAVWTDMVNTQLSPKQWFLPQTEELFAWRTEERVPAITSPAAQAAGLPLVVFGVRPCDAAALGVVDQAMLEGEWPDTAYLARRRATVVVSWACDRTAPECLCDSCGLSPADEAGDIMVLSEPAAAILLVRGLTERGNKVVARARLLLSAGNDVSPDDTAENLSLRYAARQAELAGQATAIGQMVDLCALPAATAEGNLRLFNHPAWPDLAARCVSCGTCAYVCPTCHCFAVTDEPAYTSGRRVRTWDSCQFKEFMAAAGGHNPRPTRTERVRQRFMHKLGYHRERHGSLMCVGCGRCVQLCPVGLHIAEAGYVLAAGEEAGR